MGEVGGKASLKSLHFVLIYLPFYLSPERVNQINKKGGDNMVVYPGQSVVGYPVLELDASDLLFDDEDLELLTSKYEED